MSSTLARLGIAGAALVAAVGLGAAPAQAAGPLNVAAHCADTPNYVTNCAVWSITGGTAPYTVRWDRNYAYQPGLDGVYDFSYQCRNTSYHWTVRVTDANGTTKAVGPLRAPCTLNPT
ncbi:hypothetical protein AB0M43_20235 [Longispora sp. NPDC051575]|uniref:hypothetical protein n=1 Tax=Longispora sp. NPDC051575 TaxID=3154943 RepID=UPI003424FA65